VTNFGWPDEDQKKVGILSQKREGLLHPRSARKVRRSTKRKQTFSAVSRGICLKKKQQHGDPRNGSAPAEKKKRSNDKMKLKREEGHSNQVRKSASL